jgi:hypothetical protein
LYDFSPWGVARLIPEEVASQLLSGFDRLVQPVSRAAARSADKTIFFMGDSGMSPQIPGQIN